MATKPTTAETHHPSDYFDLFDWVCSCGKQARGAWRTDTEAMRYARRHYRRCPESLGAEVRYFGPIRRRRA